MVIVLGLMGILSKLFHIANGHSSQKQFIQPDWALSFFTCVFGLHDLYFEMFLFYYGHLSRFPLCFGVDVTKFSKPPSSNL